MCVGPRAPCPGWGPETTPNRLPTAVWVPTSAAESIQPSLGQAPDPLYLMVPTFLATAGHIHPAL